MIDTSLAFSALFGVGLGSAVKSLVPTTGILMKSVLFLTNARCNFSLTGHTCAYRDRSLGFTQLTWTGLTQAFQVIIVDMLTTWISEEGLLLKSRKVTVTMLCVPTEALLP